MEAPFAMSERISNKFKYLKEKNMTGLVMLGLLFLNLAIIILGCFILKFLPENHGMSLRESFWESLKLILDPGGFLGTPMSAITTIVTSIIVLCGTITFTGGVIGYVTNIITNTIDNSKNGSKEIAFTDFTLILNWNERAMAIILDYVHDCRRDNKNEYIVVLSEKDKFELEKLIEKEIKAYRADHASCNKYDPRIIVRTGNPRYSSDLMDVGYCNAKAIYVMQIEGDDTPDFEVIQTCMAISATNKFTNDVVEDMEVDSDVGREDCVRVVAEVSSFKTLKMLSELSVAPIKIGNMKQNFSVSPLCNEFVLGKLYANIAMQPTISPVINEILSQAGSEFVEYNVEEDTRSIEDEFRVLKYAIPLFDTENGGRVYLSGDSSKENADFETMDEDALRISLKDEKYNPIKDEVEKNIVIWGYNSKLKYILNSVSATNRTCKYKIQLLSSENQRKEMEEIYSNPSYAGLFFGEPLYVSDGYNIGTITKLLPSEILSFLVLSRDDYKDDEKDKEVFEVWLGLHHEMELNEHINSMLRHKIILEVSSDNNASLLKHNAGDQIVISSELSSLFMVQTSVGDTLQGLLMDLISVDGDKDFADYCLDFHDDCNLEVISARNFFDSDKPIDYLSKQDMILNIYQGTYGKYIPIGVIDGDTAYLFTNGGKETMEVVAFVGGNKVPDMTDGYLINSDGDGIYGYGDDIDPEQMLRIEPEFNLVMVHKTK